jgi:hypothetical protein
LEAPKETAENEQSEKKTAAKEIKEGPVKRKKLLV